MLDIASVDMKCLDYFEDDGYTRSVVVEVEIPSQPNACESIDNKENLEIQSMQANAYIWTLGTCKLDVSGGWEYDVSVDSVPISS